MKTMKKMWQEYVDQYNAFQWWLSGLFYGLYIGVRVGSLYQEAKHYRNRINPLLVEEFELLDAIKIVFGLWTGGLSEWETPEKILEMGYSYAARDEDGLPNTTPEDFTRTAFETPLMDQYLRKTYGCSCGTKTLTHADDCSVFDPLS